MTDALGRWLLRPASLTDSILGGLLYGALVVVVFRFGFGDGWPFVVGSGIVLGLASILFTEWSRRRRERAG